MHPNDAGHLLPEFQFLIADYGFRIVALEVSPYFDNMSVLLSNSCLNVCVFRDRGFVDAEVSPHFAPEIWTPLALLRQAVLRLDSKETVTIEAQAAFLRSAYDKVTVMLSPENLDNTTALVRQVGKARFSSLFPGGIDEQ